MKTQRIFEKLPLLIDYALAVAIHSIPGISETDGTTKALYQSIAKQLLADELSNRRKFVQQNFRIVLKYPSNLRSRVA